MLMKKLVPPLAAVLCLIAIAKSAPALDWPNQPIHIIVAFGAGGGTDIIGRILADAMQERLGKAGASSRTSRAPAALSAMNWSPTPRPTATRSAS